MQPTTAVLCLAASLVGAGAQWTGRTCPSFGEAAHYDATTRRLSAPGYVTPMTTTTSIPQPASFELVESANATVQVTPEDAERTLAFRETLRQKVDGISILKDNPIFGSWDESSHRWSWDVPPMSSGCRWDTVTSYLSGGGAGLRIRRENHSKCTVFNAFNTTATEGKCCYTAEPAVNDDEIVVVLSDPAIVEISFTQANTVKITFPDDAGFLPTGRGDQYVPSICVATKRGEWGLMGADKEKVAYVGEIVNQLTTLSEPYDPNPECSGVTVEYSNRIHPFDTPSPTASPAALPSPNLSAIALGLAFAFALF